MLNLEECKILISAYKYIDRRCEAVNEFIYKHALNYGPDPEIYSTFDVINNIVELMDRRLRLSRLKDIIDEIIADMNVLDRQILLIKMKCRTSVKNIQAMLKLPSERTTFRRMENAINNFCNRVNGSSYSSFIEDVLKNEKWIQKTTRLVERSISATI